MTDAEIAITHGAEFRRCLVELDVEGIKRLHAHTAPHLAPLSDNGALYSMHLARTKATGAVPARLQLYSQRWLNERGLGSFCNDDRRGY